MMRNFMTVGAATLMAGLFLTACINNIESTRNLSTMGEGFSPQLAENYRELTLFEADQMYDWPDAWLFADKALAASRGMVPAPERVADWHIPENQIPGLKRARADLVSAIDAGFARQHPVQAAIAQTSFDCWIEQLEEGWQLDHIEKCRSAYESALNNWHVRQITSQVIPEFPPAPSEPVKYLKEPEARRSACVPAAQPVADQSARRFRVQFAHDSAVLDSAAGETLEVGAELARGGEVDEIFVEGHADRSGASEHNLRLSMKRALAVWDQLIARGVSPHKIWIGPRGEAMPETATVDGEKNADNRRVLVFLEAPLGSEMISTEGCAEPFHTTDIAS
jgi:OOP family OmpA-OmpF porin